MARPVCFRLFAQRMRAAASRTAGGAPGGEVEALFRLVHQRRPDADELTFARQFLAAAGEPVATTPGTSGSKVAVAPFGRLAELAQVLAVARMLKPGRILAFSWRTKPPFFPETNRFS